MSQPTELVITKRALAIVLDRESASTARYDVKIDKLEADNLSLRQLLKEYREDHIDCRNVYKDGPEHRCSICHKYDALEGK